MLGSRRRYQLQRTRAFPDSAPPRARRAVATDAVVTGNAVAIRRPRAELYAFWRDFENLPRFMENVREVKVLDGGRSQWTIAGARRHQRRPARRDHRGARGRADRLALAAGLRRRGRRGASSSATLPGGRGTAVEATVAYRPPGGEVGRWIAKLFQREPNVQGRRELRRLKMLMETGEIATSANRKDAS